MFELARAAHPTCEQPACVRAEDAPNKGARNRAVATESAEEPVVDQSQSRGASSPFAPGNHTHAVAEPTGSGQACAA
jgi:hypothetical protein